MNTPILNVCLLSWFLVCAGGNAGEEEKESEGGTVTPTFPEDGATSFRVLQDLHWGRQGSTIRYDLRIDRLNPSTASFELFYFLDDIPESGKLTNFGDFSLCRFDPAVFLGDLSSVSTSAGIIERAPVFYPGFQYRWGVRVAGGSAWVFRILNIEYDPLYQIGMDTHLGLPSEWFDIIFDLTEVPASPPDANELDALASDVVQFRPPYIFEGASVTWGRDHFRDPNDRFAEFRSVLNQWTQPILPRVIAHTIFQPFRIPMDSMGQPQEPVLGQDYFTMFDFTDGGPDQSLFFEETFVPKAPFGGNDPYTRPLYLYQTKFNDVEQTWHDLAQEFAAIRCQFKVVQQNPSTMNLQELDNKKMNYRDRAIQFTFGDPTNPSAPGAPPTGDIRAQYEAYVRSAVAEFKDRVELWHYHNEASGKWYMDPHLYARQLAFFAEAVWDIDPQERIMVASMVQPNTRSCSGQSLLAESPDIFWFEQFVERVRDLIEREVIDRLPFQSLGLNGGFRKDDEADPDACVPGDCPVPPPSCDDLIEQDCRFGKLLAYYREFRQILDQLEVEFNTDLSIIYKETATSHPDLSIAAQEAPRGIAFLHELGHLKTNSPVLFSASLPGAESEGGESSTVVEEKLFNSPGLSEVEAVLWFHYHLDLTDLTRHVNVIEPTTFPNIIYTPFEAALRDVNYVSCVELVTADAGPDQYTFCNGTVGIGTESPHYYHYEWSPQEGLSDPFSATPSAGPAATTTYTLTVTNLCGEQATDQARVRVLPVITDLEILNSSPVHVGDPLEIDLAISCGQSLDEPIRLRLHNATDPDSTFITTVPPQSASFSWCPPGSVPAAQRYFIEATTIDGNALHLAQSNEFDLSSSSATLLQPDGGFFGEDGILPVSWIWQGGGGLVALSLVRSSDGIVVANITVPGSPIPGASGSLNWTYSGLTVGENYFVRMELVECLVGLVWSGPSFSIGSIELQMTDPWCGQPSFFWTSSLPSSSILRLRIVSDNGVTDDQYLVPNFGMLVLARQSYPTNTNYTLTIEAVDDPSVRDEVILVTDC